MLLNNTSASLFFALEGEFAGFFRDILGKRRIVLRVDGEEVFLKIPKSLRRELDGQLHAGQMVRVTGHQSPEPKAGRDGRVVLGVQVAGEDACITCPIRVCVKKTCWRNGGRELWHELQRHIEAAGLQDSVKLKAVDCLDHCKKGPNVEIAGCDFHRCAPRDAEKLLEHLAGHAV